jgi:MFS family permease
MFHVLAARALRAFGDGFASLVFPLYLIELGMTPVAVGVLSTLTLLGSAALALAAGFLAARIGERRALVAAALLRVATGAGLASFTGCWPLAVVALAGTLNPSSGDASVFMPLEHAVLSARAAPSRRTAIFARYSLTGALFGALGALCVGLPTLAAHVLPLALGDAYRLMFVVYALLALGCALVYRRLPAADMATPAQPPSRGLGPSRRRVLLLAGLFGVDAFAGGFIVQSLLGLWLVERFGIGAPALGALFFATGLLAGVSYLAAVPIARRIGLVNTMVFTHMPSSVLLIATAFASDVRVAVALLLARSLLSQVDVPTRSSYVMAVVTPAERAAAAGVTGVPRSLAAAVSPLLAGTMLAASTFGWPLLVAGALKIAYDLALLAAFRDVHPPEEAATERVRRRQDSPAADASVTRRRA